MTDPTKFLKGYVHQYPVSLDDVAEKSPQLFYKIKKAPTGRFEEYEGYQAEAMGFLIYFNW
jgi:hypothetical protein